MNAHIENGKKNTGWAAKKPTFLMAYKIMACETCGFSGRRFEFLPGKDLRAVAGYCPKCDSEIDVNI